MFKILAASLIICLISLSSTQNVPSLDQQVNQLDQYIANLTSADVAAAKNYILSSSENAVNSTFAPFINNATDVMVGLINSANQTAQNFTQAINNAISFNANGDTYSIQIAGGNATITFNNITNLDVAALTKICEVYNKTGNLVKAIDGFLFIVAHKNMQAAEAVAEVLSSFFPIYFENLWEKVKCMLDPNCAAYEYSDNSDCGATVEATECSTVAEPTNCETVEQTCETKVEKSDCETSYEKTGYGNTAPESTNCETTHEKTEYGNTAPESTNCETVEQTCETEVEKTECETTYEKTEYGNTAPESTNCETVEQTCETDKEETCETVEENTKSNGNTVSESTYCETEEEKTVEETCETVTEETKSYGNTESEAQTESTCETDNDKTKSDGNTASESTCETDAEATEATETTKMPIKPDGVLPPVLSDAKSDLESDKEEAKSDIHAAASDVHSDAHDLAENAHSDAADVMGSVQSGVNHVASALTPPLGN